MHGAVERSKRRSTLHAASVESLVLALHVGDLKNTVEHIVVGIALVNPLPYGSSLSCLEGERIAGGEVTTVCLSIPWISM